MLAEVPGEVLTYYSSYTLCSDNANSASLEADYPKEFLNSLSLNGFPKHEIMLQPFTPIMLLRNLNPSAGLCNGTWIMITHLGENVIKGTIMGGSLEGSVVEIPRRQYLIRFCYAMTINKSQGQTLDRVGIFLPKPVFGHGQIYVAASRVRSADRLRILINHETQVAPGCTRNIVYVETFDGLPH
ncbi:ATP-dependent DNA helicase PIF1 [Linum perenne]